MNQAARVTVLVSTERNRRMMPKVRISIPDRKNSSGWLRRKVLHALYQRRAEIARFAELRGAFTQQVVANVGFAQL